MTRSARSSVVSTLRAAGCVFAEEEADLLLEAAGSPGELDDLVARRCAGHPLELVVGWARFCGLRIAVGPGVFVPRRRTELLARLAVDLARAAPSPAVALDVCCGSGALGAVLLDALPDTELVAADLETAAVECARRNLGDRGTVVRGDLFDPLPAVMRGRVDVLMANVPYVPSGEIHLLPAEARLHEPLVTLDGGVDGLDLLRGVAAGAPDWLAAGGSVLCESSERQAPLAVAAFVRRGLAARVVTDDELGATVVVGTRPA